MVQVEEISSSSAAGAEVEDVLPSLERLLDAQEIEQMASQLHRPTAKLHLTSLATKLRREAEALQRIEKNRHLSSSSPPSSPSKENEPTATPTEFTPPHASGGTSKDVGRTHTTSTVVSPPPSVAAPLATSNPIVIAPGGTYVPIDRFAFDAGGYNAPFVTLYVDLVGVGSIDRNSITCDFTSNAFDLIVRNLNNKSYRLFKDNLEKDIDPTKSQIVVKSNKIIIKLAKIKSEYGSYDYWTQLSAKRQRKSSNSTKDDPHQSIMQLMKDMYEEGDDNMRKVIGETMLKQQRGELNKENPMGGASGMGGLRGGFGEFNDDDL